MSKIVVLFEVKISEGGKDQYLKLAAMLKNLLSDFEGFVKAERFVSLSEDGKMLSMSVWNNEEALNRWRNVAKHRMSQKEGRENMFESYNITVASVIREYSETDRAQAPDDSNQSLL